MATIMTAEAAIATVAHDEEQATTPKPTKGIRGQNGGKKAPTTDKKSTTVTALKAQECHRKPATVPSNGTTKRQALPVGNWFVQNPVDRNKAVILIVTETAAHGHKVKKSTPRHVVRDASGVWVGGRKTQDGKGFIPMVSFRLVETDN
jgi:hypothetical protein